MGIEVRCVAGECHQSISTSVVAYLRAAVHPGLSRSCNKEEVPLALERMRQAGAQITTSEGILFQLQGATYRPQV